MNDRRLLKFYLERGAPEAQRWNLSPGNLAAELSSRTLLSDWVKPRRGFAACNLGIGVGEWDDYLGYWLEGRGTLTSIDDDRSVCDVFRHRQRREHHPNPSRVFCRDFLAEPAVPGAYDLVTLIGTTASETGNLRAAVAACFRLLRPNGRLFYMDFRRLRAPGEFPSAVRAVGGRVVRRAGFRRGGFAHHCLLACRA